MDKRAQFLSDIEGIYAECFDILKRKNADYATDEDPWHNLSNAKAVGHTVEGGILIRVMDKITRISNLVKRAAVVKDESVEDSIKDAINYLALLLAYRRSHERDSS